MKFTGKIIFPVLFILFFHNAHSGNSISEKKNCLTESFAEENSTFEPDFFLKKYLVAPPVLTLNPSLYNGYNISCNGDSDGSIDLTITGGLPPFDILWSNGEVTEDIDTLTAGNYSVRVIDANNDTVFSNIDLIQPDPIGIIIDSIANILCNGGNNGFIGISLTGGVPAYVFSWSDASTNEDLQNVVFGTYTVTVTDVNLCTATLSAIVTQPAAALSTTTSSTNSTCGNANGSATANPAGGTVPYSYLWSNGQTTQTATLLAAATYTVTVTDDNGCTISAAQLVSNTNGPAVVLDSIHNENCFGETTGDIFIAASGGTGTLSYLWSNAATVQDLQNVVFGTYTVTVTDVNLCTATLSAIVTQPAAALSTTTSSTNSTCGNANGSATANPAGGTVPYSYLWSNGQTTQTATLLAAATYTVTVTDDNGCTISAAQLVSNTNGPAVVLDSIHNENCFGETTGDIFIAASGGTGTLSYLWSNAATVQDLQNVVFGTYTVTVTDVNLCTATLSAIVTQPAAALSTTTSSTNSTCGNANGSATANPAGGTVPYSYLWSNGQTTQTATLLAAATYTVTVTDDNGCTISAAQLVSNTNGPAVVLDSIHNENCFGETTGDIFIAASGGTGTLSYLWSNAATVQDLQNVVFGTYTVTVTDVNLCTATLSAIVTQPAAALSTTTSSTNSTCGNANGSATANPAGGTVPYSYLWSNGQTTQTATLLAAATYTVTVTDDNGCTISAAQLVSNTNGPAVVLDSIHNENCFGETTGDIFIAASGGTGTLSYLWSNAATVQDLQNVVFGTYTVTVTDVNLCTATLSAIVTQPAAALSTTTSSTNSTCGNANGSATANPAGGTVPYSYLWSNGQTTQTATLLAAATYTVTVTDDNGCTISAAQLVSNTNGPAVVLDSIHNENCFGETTGDIFIAASGGTGTLSYLWSNAATVQDLQNVVFGTYTVTVTDVNLCTATLSAIVTQPAAALSTTTSSTNSTCGNANGSATANPAGGTVPYSYLWSNGQTTQTATLLAAATYTVTVTDDNGCTISAAQLVSNTNGPAVVLDSIHNENCFGETTGDIFIAASGGTGTLSYLWSNAATVQDLQNVVFGTYTVTVTDVNLCTATLSAIVTQPAAALSTTTSSTNSTCGNANGSATANPAGGTVPYSYLWSNGQTTQTATLLAAATYTVTVTDDNGCTISAAQLVSNTNGPAVVLDSIHNENCFGETTGDIFIAASGGTGTLSYLWSNAATVQDLQNVVFGTYTVTVTDVNLCTATLSAIVTQPAAALSTTTSSTNSTCGNANGSATANPAGGTVPYSYLWSNGQTTQTATLLAAATYTVTVTDDNGCTISAAQLVSNTNGPAVVLDSIHNENCFGETTGDIFIAASGGTGTLSYLWSNAATVQDLQNVVFGTYTVTVTDVNLCTATLSAIVTQPAAALSTTTSSTNSTCGNANGSATANPAGGTVPYSYLWSNGQTTQTATLLAAATYTVTVTDDNGCTISAAQLVSNTNGPAVVLDSIHNENCFGETTGDIFIAASGGTGTLSYLWSNAATVQDLQNVVFGTYTVTVTDVNLCTATLSAIVTQPAAALSTTTSSTNSTCGNANGSATANPAGGTVPYSYLWSNGQTTQTATLLAAATYTVTVTDDNGCTISAAQLVSNTNGPAVVLDSIHNENCFGETTGDIFIAASGGTGTLSYLWSNAATVQDLQNVVFGTYTVTVTDVNLCTATLSAIVTQPAAALSTTTSSTNSTCGNANGSATANPAGGTVPYSYLWSNGQTTQTATLLAAATYTVTVTDDNGCTISAAQLVSNTNGPAVVLDSIHNENCFGETTGDIFIAASGGTGTLSYLWSNAATVQDLQNVVFGTYTVTVTDVNLCTATLSAIVTQPAAALSTTTSSTNSTCGNANGSATANPAGGTVPYSYLWSNGQTTQTATLLAAATYTVTVTDDNGCTISAAQLVSNTNGPAVVLDSIHNENCFGETTGDIFIAASGGTGTLSYLWSNAATVQDLQNVVFGTYTVTVTDVNLCTATLSAIVTQPAAALSTTTSSTNSTCGNANGSATANPAGGTVPYSYLWSNGQTTQTATLLAAATYTVTVTDDNGCTISAAQLVSNTNGPAVVLDSIHNENCFGETTGDIFIAASGGTGTLSYLWSNAATVQDLQNVVFGTYTVTVTDVNLCTATLSAIVTQPAAALSTTTSSTNSTCGNANGSATANPAGGTVPYSYLWSNGQTTQTATLLAAATYTVTVTDDNGCTISAAQLVSNTNGPAVVLDSIHNENCFGETTGDIFIAASGGTGTLSYLWSNAATVQDLQNVVFGTYTVTVTDVNLCTATLSAIVTQPAAALSTTTSSTNSTCGNANGSATANPAGGTVPYSYLWSNGQTTQTATLLAAATYTVTVTDDNGCTISAAQLVSNTNGPAVVLDSIHNENCFGETTGDIFIAASGGTGTLSYLWSNAATVQDLQNVVFGTYTVTVTDVNLCTATLSAIVTQPAAALSTTTSSTNSTCGNANGSATANPAGGTVPYSYLWSNGQTTQTATLLAAATYTVTVTDDNFCIETDSVTVNGTPPPIATITTINYVTCYGDSNGTIDITISNGTPPFSFLWSNGYTTEDLSALHSGNYTVTVTDFNLCTTSVSDSIIQPDSISISMIITPSTGLPDGSIVTNVIGGTIPYSYLWSNGSTTSFLNSLVPGFYSLTLTDNLACVEDTVAIVAGICSIIVDSVIPVTSFGGSDGAIFISPMGIIPPVTYLWSNSATTDDITSLVAGTYTITITDFLGCSTSLDILVTEPTACGIAIDSVKNVNCYGDSTGAIYITPAGGVAPYIFLWSSGATTEDITNIPAGEYTITITDNNSCSAIDSITITENPQLIATDTSTFSTCNFANGTATVFPSGGAGPPYNYLWSGGQTTQTIVGLVPGTYSVTITDNIGCSIFHIVTVTSPGNPLVHLDSLINVSCNGLNDGAIYISITGGTDPYTYFWSNSATTDDINNLSPITYTVLVLDVNNCNTDTSFTITQPPVLNDSIHLVNESCGYGNGTLTVYPFGGTSPYTFLWSTGDTTQIIDSLAAGTYTVTVTDNNGCTKVSSATVINITAPVIQLDSIVHVKCNGQNNGAIYISISGGTPPFQYLWTPGAFTGEDDIALVAGNYSVIVSDTNNCKDTSAIFTVTEPALLGDSIQFTAATCNGPTGSATVFPYGGTLPFSYLWSNSVTTQTISNVIANTYYVTVEDLNNCLITDSVIIPDIGVPLISIDSVKNIKCYGDSIGAIYITVTSGVLPYSYQWSNGDTIQDGINLIGGIYTVTVTDGNNCTTTITDTVHQPSSPLNDTISVINAHCNHADGSLTVFPFGGTGPLYTYQWSNSQTIATISNLFAGIYTVTVTDANGCTLVSTDSVGNLAPPIIVVDSTKNLKCNGDINGAIFISISGGDPGYSYVWSNGFTTQDLSNLIAGIYTVTVTDTNQCIAIDTISITQPLALLDSIVITNASCGDSNGIATIYPYGGIFPYDYLWFDGQTSQSIDSLLPGSYTFTITDANGCTHIDNANISNVGGPNVIVDSIKNVSCHGANDGAIYVTPSGGSPPYVYVWSPGGATGQDTINLSGGTYTLTITDSANCIKVISQVIDEPDPIILTPSSTNSNCNTSTGTASVQVTGGTLPYSYLWSNGQTIQNINGIPAGTYTVTVTDAHGCIEDTSTIVINPDGPIISNAIITNVSCFGGLTGGVNITVISGTLPYSYLWSNTFPPVTTQDLTNVGAGVYTVIITDGANCTTSQTYTITEPPDLQISFSITPPSCNSSNGSVIATVTGGTGTGTYTYLWNNSQTTDNLSGLPAGSYTLTVTDANLCKDSAIANLSNIAAPSITVIDSGMVSCYGANDGFISVNVTGGQSPYTYSWTNTSQTGPLITNLAGGITYTLTVTDSAGCITVRSVYISEPDSIDILANIPFQNGFYNIKCYGGSDGSITIIPTGGTPSFTYLWSYNANQSQNLTNIPAGSYTVTVTDAHGCSEDSTFTLTEPPQLISDAGTNYVICGQTTDTLHANIPPYGTGEWIVAGGNGIVLIPNSPITPVSNLSVGTNNIFQWIVSDDSCSVLSQIIISVNSAITAIPGADRKVCNDSVVLTAVPPQFGSGFWSVVNGGGILVDSTIAQTSVISLTPGINTFLWSVMNGTCTDSAFVNITLRDPADCLEAIQMPTGITPNGDEKNDVFFVQGLADYYENSILIYNRWGNKVFEQSPYLNNWHGTNQSGGLLPEGTYFVILKIKGIEKTFTGYIDLRR